MMRTDMSLLVRIKDTNKYNYNTSWHLYFLSFGDSKTNFQTNNNLTNSGSWLTWKETKRKHKYIFKRYKRKL